MNHIVDILLQTKGQPNEETIMNSENSQIKEDIVA
jgi:hypothetical protein